MPKRTIVERNTDGLVLFTEVPLCEKCLNTDVMSRYKTKEAPVAICDECEGCHKKEHLHITCRNCGFRWGMEVANKSE